MSKERLDKKLTQLYPILSRNKAQQLITAGQVKIDGAVVFNVAMMIHAEHHIELLSLPRYVSRGGEKLEGALKTFNIYVENKICLDIGASTGGFTDCLRQHGAQKVFAVDVGEGQLANTLQQDKGVISFEKTHVNQLATLPLLPPSVVVIDVSFISLKKVLPFVFEALSNSHPDIIALVKPQFEFADYFPHKNFDKLQEHDIEIMTQKQLFFLSFAQVGIELHNFISILYMH